MKFVCILHLLRMSCSSTLHLFCNYFACVVHVFCINAAIAILDDFFACTSHLFVHTCASNLLLFFAPILHLLGIFFHLYCIYAACIYSCIF